MARFCAHSSFGGKKRTYRSMLDMNPGSSWYVEETTFDETDKRLSRVETTRSACGDAGA